MRILQVGTLDRASGAATVAGNLMRAYRRRGCQVSYVVGLKQGDDPDVIVLPDERRTAFRLTGYCAARAGLKRLAGQHPRRGWGLAGRLLRAATHPAAVVNRWRGIEDFDFPGTYELLQLADSPPDVVHCHNLHGGYFDLRALEWIGRQLPLVLTLHDMWLLTGHCAYSLGCERWRTGCGECPDLHLEPAVRRDGTATNWRRKRAIYGRSRLHVATSSRWLMDKVQASMLGAAAQETRVIPDGVDLSVFRPGNKHAARDALGIPPGATVVMLTAGSPGSMYKDDRTLASAAARIAEAAPDLDPLFLTVGREMPAGHGARAGSLSIPPRNSLREMATCYQAADVYLHAAHADTFPSSVLEALACGTPVVATSVGGIVEQVASLDISALPETTAVDRTDATGILVPAGDDRLMADAATALLRRPELCQRLAENGARTAVARFDSERQADRYLEWYGEIVSRRREFRRSAGTTEG